LGRQGMGIFQ